MRLSSGVQVLSGGWEISVGCMHVDNDKCSMATGSDVMLSCLILEMTSSEDLSVTLR